MFIVTAKVPKRRFLLLGILASLSVVLFLALLHGRLGGGAAQHDALRAESDAARAAFLAARGWEVEPEPVESVRLTLPQELVEPYLSYNELQLQQGFDLTPYLGQTLERFTYQVTNHPTHTHGCQADLYLHHGIVVAGDVICTGEGGFISTLEFPATEKK